MMNQSKFTFSKNLLSGVQPCPNFNYVGLKKIYGGHKIFFRDQKNRNFLKFIYNNKFFFLDQGGLMATLNSMWSRF